MTVQPATLAIVPQHDLEIALSDLAQMAKLAELSLHDVIGEIEFNGAAVVRHDLTPESVARTIFAVSHLAEMIEGLQKRSGLR